MVTFGFFPDLLADSQINKLRCSVKKAILEIDFNIWLSFTFCCDLNLDCVGEGVEEVKGDFSSGKLTVTGNVDPSKLREKVEEKTKKKVEVISPAPKKDGGEKKSEEKKPEKPAEEKKTEEKKPKEVIESIHYIIMCISLANMCCTFKQ